MYLVTLSVQTVEQKGHFHVERYFKVLSCSNGNRRKSNLLPVEHGKTYCEIQMPIANLGIE